MNGNPCATPDAARAKRGNPKFRSEVMGLGQEANRRRAAHRALDDPAKLARAARIVRAALARQMLTLDELTPLPDTRKGAA